MDIASLLFLAVMVEGIVTYVSSFCLGGKCQWKMLASMVLGIVVAINFEIDVFEFLGFESTIPYMSKILTGIIIGRGSNYVADFLKTVQNYMGNGSGKK
ncbi:MAG: hypothetical protein BWY15_01096 [Firmicutes bacterium ADurb.Bin193]|nr:MAG: hypothetical protein BWY15_01096 [Firmicutes bacterium ADurb.Bin193]